MQKALYSTVIALASFAPWAHGQTGAVTGAKILTVPALLVVQMPEPSSPALLAIDLLSVGGLIVLFRHRANGTNR
ncbi:MAG: hypothetical protein ACLQOO_11055 [Terriglobia bacterium]